MYMIQDEFLAIVLNFAIVNLQPKKGTRWVCFFDRKNFVSYGCAPHKNIPHYIKTKNGKRI